MSLSCQSMSCVLRPVFEKGRSTDIEQLFQAFLLHPAHVTGEVNPIPFLHALQQAGCILTDDDRSHLLNAIQAIEASLDRCGQPAVDGVDPQKVIRDAFQLQHPDEHQRHQLFLQLHHRLLGILYGVLTASALPQKEKLDLSRQKDDWVTWLNLCGIHWDAAWTYPLEDSFKGAGISNGQAQLGRIDSVLLHASAHDWLHRVTGNNWSKHGTTWLTVRRLLCFLLSEAESQPGRKQMLPVLWVRRCNDQQQDEDSQGVVRGVSLQLCSENRSGWYLDPVSFGITVFDDDMQQSIEISGRLSWPSLKHEPAGTIRLAPARYSNSASAGDRALVLSGNSAGGLTGCGMYALAQGSAITDLLTASVALRLKSERSLAPGLTNITEDDFDCLGVGGAVPKLVSAAKAGLRGVAVHKDNEAEAKAFRETEDGANCEPAITNSFSELYRYLTHGFRINQAVQDHASLIIDKWKKARGGAALDGERHQLDVFVKPRVSVLLEVAHSEKPSQEVWKELPPGVQHLIDDFLIPSDRWFVITEDAGGGKTVLSHYLMAALSRHAHRFWVVRFEGTFPDNLRSHLEDLFTGQLARRGIEQTAEQVLDDLLDQRRVVVIYDALDQDNSDKAAERIHQLRHNNADERVAKQLRLIVTSRPYAVNQQHSRIFGRDEWQHCRLELFSETQQDDYRKQVARLWQKKQGGGNRIEELYQQVTPDREAIADLLAYPVVQWLIRTIVEASLDDSSSARLRPFRNAGDLYWEVSHRLLGRAFKSGRFTQQPDDIPLLFEAIACYGFQMMLRFRDYRVPSGEIPTVKHEVRRRFNGADAEWDRCSRILKDTYLTEHLLLKENNRQELSFPSLKMMEFFAGVYLGRYCSGAVLPELSTHIGDEKWNNVWQFVAELPETTDQDGRSAYRTESLTCSLHALFAVPQRNTRPTESMFRAWQVLTRNEFLQDVRAEVLAEYRHQFHSILIEMDRHGEPTQRARTAAEVIHDDDLRPFVSSALDREMEALNVRWQELDAIKRRNRKETAELTQLQHLYDTLQGLDIDDWCRRIRPAFQTFALCSDEQKNGNADRLTFMMGASPEDKNASDNEKPWQRVDLAAFYIATACVTKAQYRLFDSQLEQEHADSMAERCPDDACPMIEVDFFDSFCFALILGDRYTLPGECEWEGAAWGGIDREQHLDHVIGVPPFTAAFTSREVNFDGNHPLDAKKSEYREKAVPVRGDGFQPNGFGLWHMNGNVWEWCRSEWWGILKEAISQRDAKVETDNASGQRCVRGGSWFNYGRYCRSSIRIYFGDYRHYSTGFRLSRTK